MDIRGACHCGTIAYDAVVDPARVTICHCNDCQALTGSAYRVSVPTPRESFRLRRGTPKIYIKTGDSGARRAQAFCPDCGSPLYTYAADNPTTYGLRVGCIEERRALPPTRRIWCRSTLDWSLDLRGLEMRERE